MHEARDARSVPFRDLEAHLRVEHENRVKVTITNNPRVYYDNSAIGQPTRFYRLGQLPKFLNNSLRHALSGRAA
jgi:hypothetical protein